MLLFPLSPEMSLIDCCRERSCLCGGFEFGCVKEKRVGAGFFWVLLFFSEKTFCAAFCGSSAQLEMLNVFLAKHSIIGVTATRKSVKKAFIASFIIIAVTVALLLANKPQAAWIRISLRSLSETEAHLAKES